MTSSSKEAKIVTAENCIQAGWQAGFKAAFITCVATAIPTLAAVRTIPWAKASINYTGQALIISGASIAAFFINADKTILHGAKKNARYDMKP
ncbi:early nodulin-93-like [Primulina tabacum]|uniref:early nodulin-93-like n=1 Tax=Primulina tabacum TaxID=48773 RepID=UPI003F5A0535